MNEKLHHYHLALTMYMIQVGIVFFSLPRLTAENFGTNGWLSLLIFSAVACFNIFLIACVHRKGRGQSIFTILENTLPKWVLYPIYLFLVVTWAMLGGLAALEFSQVLQLMSFPTTSPFTISFIMALLALFLLRQGVYNIVKATVIFFYISFWLTFLTLAHVQQFEWLRLTPFLFQGETHMVRGSFTIYPAFLGYELFLLLLPYVHPKAKFVKAMYIGHLYTTFIYVLTCIIAYGFFSFPLLLQGTFPVFSLIAYVKLPFIERIESFAIMFFLFKVLLTSVFYYWAAQETLQRVVPRIHPWWITLFIVGGTYLISWKWNLHREVVAQLKWLQTIEIAIAFGLPLLLLLILWIQKATRRDVHA